MTRPYYDSNQYLQNDEHLSQIAISKVNTFQTALTNINKLLSELDSKVNTLIEQVNDLETKAESLDVLTEKVNKVYTSAENSPENYTDFRYALITDS